MIDILARNGADVNASSPRLGGLLHSAAFFGDIATVENLLEFGADIHKQHVRMSHGSALHSACAGGHLDVVTLLLRKGADVNLRIPSIDKKCGGYTPFLMAMPLNHCSSSGIEVCQILLSAGADPVAKSDAGETLLDIVERAPEATNPFRAEQILFLSKVFKERDEAHRGE